MTTISRDVAANVLYHFRGEGYPGGSFIEALLLAFARADTINRFNLGVGFPEHLHAVVLATEDPNGIDKLRAIYKGEHDG